MRTINQGFEEVPLANLKPHPKNVNQGDFGAIQESIETNGFFGAVTANKRTGHILAGNHRYFVAKQQHADTLPVVWVDVSDEEELRILLADNRTTRLGADDESALAALLADLAQTEIGLAGTGYDGDDLDEIIGRLAGESGGGTELLTDPDEVPDNAPTRCNPGDLWQMGRHRLLCGDSTKREDVERLMGGEKADMVFTDPPYGVNYEGGHNQKKRQQIQGDALAGGFLTALFKDSLTLACDFTNPHTAFYVWFSSNKSVEVFKAFGLLPLELRAVLQWYKVHSGLGAFMAQYIPNAEPCIYAFKCGCTPQWFGPSDEKSVWEVQRTGKNEFHPTQKPVELPSRAIRNSSAPGQIIFDMFGGSGSTLIAAEAQDRRAYLIEIDPRYCDVILTRWENATGQSATLLEAGNGN